MEGFDSLVHRFLAAPSGKAEQRGFKGIDTDSFRLDVIGSFEFLMFEVMARLLPFFVSMKE